MLTEQDIANLARYLLNDEPLPWVTPRVPVSLSLKAAFSRHRKMFGSARFQQGGGGNRGRCQQLRWVAPSSWRILSLYVLMCSGMPLA